MALSYTAALFGVTAAAYTFLTALLLLSKPVNRTGTTLLIACVGTAGSAAALASGWVNLLGATGAATELGISGTWCAFLLHLFRKQLVGNKQIIYAAWACGAAIGISIIFFAFLIPNSVRSGSVPLSVTAELASRLALSLFGVLLTENLYRNTATDYRWFIKLLCIGLGCVFVYGTILYADALLFRRLSPLLWDGRAIALVLATPLFAVSAARNRDWAIDIHVSRTVVLHTATLIGGGSFLLALAITGEILREIGPSWGDLAEVTLVIAGLTVLTIVLASGSARSRLRRFIADNFYSHQYDYRMEWMRTTNVLSIHSAHSAVQTRVINAVANIADSPAGVLCVRDLDGTAFQWAGSWNRPAVAITEPSDSAFIGLFRAGAWVVELDEAEDRPGWLSEMPDAWLAVPLAQQAQLIGFIVLVRPRAPVKLDRETFDLLRIVASQVATHIAEQRYAQALNDARRLREYGKRFAFVAHDMKNVASQLKMIVQNARVHGDNPEFQQDVLATVRVAVDRMDGLLGKLRPEQGSSNDGLIVPIDIINEEIAAIRRHRGAKIEIEDDGEAAAVAMDGAAFRSVITHLCENALDASGGPVQMRVQHGPLRVQIDIVDQGSGMTAEFIRDKLFQPFGSTKGNGFGIGAYQARELVRAAGGDLVVDSRPGSGTTMRILLPCVPSRSETVALRSGTGANR